jgi:signal transduction histidine kinase
MDAQHRPEAVRAAIEQLGPADHACTLYDRREDEVGIAVSYIRVGLERGERCVCVVDDGAESVLGALASEGIDVDSELRAGRLAVLVKPFQTGGMPGQIEQWAKEARDAGYASFRIVGEMTWALNGDLKKLAEYEARLNLDRVFERHACTGLCQFDMRRFTPEMLREMIIVHPLVVVGDRVCRNLYYVPPERYLSPDWPRHETDWMMTNLEQLQRAQDSLRASRKRSRSLARRLVEVQEAERHDLARELHDRVGQTLTAMRINMDMIRTRLMEHDDPLVRERNDDSIELIDGVFRSVENVMYELRPPMIDQYGLIASLQWYARTFAERTGTRVAVRGDEDRRFGSEVELALFRIAQEALNNAARHAQAGNITIELREVGPDIVLTIEDDGVGFDREAGRAAEEGYGLVTMRERSEAVGGTFAIHSGKGEGTRITVQVRRT